MTANEADQTRQRTHRARPVGIKVLVAVNAVTALILLVMFPQYSGGRALLYLCVGILHAVLGVGLYFQTNWARVLMIIYALFQVAGMGLWSLIGLMTLLAVPVSTEKAEFLVLSAVAIPFLLWSALYLLGQLRKAPPSQSG